jgi:DNA-binding MarR family transcriptional regulator
MAEHGTQTRAVRESSLGWMIQRIARGLDEAMNARLSPHGLSIQTFAVMMTVLEHGPLTQTAIGKQFGMPAYAISRAIDTLEELGFVARRAHEASRRAHMIHVTEAGAAFAGTLHAIVREVNDDLTASLSATERAQFGAILARLLTGAAGR